MVTKDVNSFYADATTFTPPSDISVIYLYNPFDEIVMERVVQNILKQKESFKNNVYVIYVNPSCKVLENNFSLLKKIDYSTGSTVEFYKI